MNKERNLKELFFLFVMKITCNSEKEIFQTKEQRNMNWK